MARDNLTDWCKTAEVQLVFLQLRGGFKIADEGGLVQQLLLQGKVPMLVVSTLPLSNQPTHILETFYNSIRSGHSPETALHGNNIGAMDLEWASLEMWYHPEQVVRPHSVPAPRPSFHVEAPQPEVFRDSEISLSSRPLPIIHRSVGEDELLVNKPVPLFAEAIRKKMTSLLPFIAMALLAMAMFGIARTHTTETGLRNILTAESSHSGSGLETFVLANLIGPDVSGELLTAFRSGELLKEIKAKTDAFEQAWSSLNPDTESPDCDPNQVMSLDPYDKFIITDTCGKTLLFYPGILLGNDRKSALENFRISKQMESVRLSRLMVTKLEDFFDPLSKTAIKPNAAYVIFPDGVTRMYKAIDYLKELPGDMYFPGRPYFKAAKENKGLIASTIYYDAAGNRAVLTVSRRYDIKNSGFCVLALDFAIPGKNAFAEQIEALGGTTTEVHIEPNYIKHDDVDTQSWLEQLRDSASDGSKSPLLREICINESRLKRGFLQFTVPKSGQDKTGDVYLCELDITSISRRWWIPMLLTGAAITLFGFWSALTARRSKAALDTSIHARNDLEQKISACKIQIDNIITTFPSCYCKLDDNSDKIIEMNSQFVNLIGLSQEDGERLINSDISFFDFLHGSQSRTLYSNIRSELIARETTGPLEGKHTDQRLVCCRVNFSFPDPLKPWFKLVEGGSEKEIGVEIWQIWTRLGAKKPNFAPHRFVMVKPLGINAALPRRATKTVNQNNA